MWRLVPLFFVLTLSINNLFSAETSIQDALDKARQRAGAPAPDAKAKREKAAQEAARKRIQEEKLRQEREEEINKAKAEEKAKTSDGTKPASPPPPPTNEEKKPNRIFTLKDGTQIEAVMVIELQDTYALKDKDGKLREVKRDDVESIKDAP